MKREAAISFSIAIVCLTLLVPKVGQAQSAVSNNYTAQASPDATALSQAQDETMRMVPAQVTLAGTLDARKAEPGQQFQARLSDTIHLKDGTELPHGTILIGSVAANDMQQSGTKLALSFTQAQLKDGKVIPIKATIMGVSQQGTIDDTRDDSMDPSAWNQKDTGVDAADVLSGVDLHSQIASRNSGVFMSTKKDDVKLRVGTVLELAIAVQTGEQGTNGMNGGY